MSDIFFNAETQKRKIFIFKESKALREKRLAP